MIDDATLDAPVVELAAMLDAGKVTSVALTDAYLARIERRGPALNCFITVTPQRARSDAARADARRAAGERAPLLGIPYALKDVIDTAGILSTWGTRALLERVPTQDADVAVRLRDAGAVLLGKLHCTELANAFGVKHPEDAHGGACKNPWDLTRWAGGSSGGAAAAVAAGLVGFAIGTETHGSIDCPAAFCGVTGVRPTYDLVSRAGVLTLAWTLDKVGPLVRDARDARVVLSAIATQPLEPREERRLRVGLVDQIDPKIADPAFAAAFARAREVIATYADIETITFPDLPIVPATQTVLLAEIHAAFEDFARAGGVHALFDREPWSVKQEAYRSLDLRAEDYIKAMRVRAELQRACQAIFTRHDIVLAPGRHFVATPLANSKFPDSDAPNGFFTTLCVGNLVGAPAVTVPIGLSAAQLPLSLHAIAAPYQDDTLLAFAEQYQARTDHHRRRPPAG